MMIVTTLLALVVSLLKYLLLYYLGEVLMHPEELRSFLGLNQNSDSPEKYARISSYTDLAGRVIKIIALVGAISSIVTSFLVISI